MKIKEIPVPKRPKNSELWLIIAAIALGVLTLVMCAVILLVLTGIIAEPETVFTNIGKMLFGR